MSDKPLVSVVIPYFDHARYLPDAVRSALWQTYSNFEVIVVDDAGPYPAEGLLCDKFSDDRLKVVRRDENGGSSAAKNTGIAIAAGNLILPLDSDDLLEPNYIEETVVALSGTEYGGVFTQTKVFGMHNFVHVPECTVLSIMSGFPAPTTFVYKREVFDSVGGYRTDIYHDDDEFWISALENGWTFCRLEKPLYHYRKHPNGKSCSNRDAAIASFARHHKELYSAHLPEILQKMQAKYFQMQDHYQELYAAYERIEADYISLSKDHSELETAYNKLLREQKTATSDKAKRKWF
jgi:glycosyltransferase involved in cell wall biosynthesis